MLKQMKSLHITYINIFWALDLHNFRTKLVWGVKVKEKGIESHLQWYAFFRGEGRGAAYRSFDWTNEEAAWPSG